MVPSSFLHWKCFVMVERERERDRESSVLEAFSAYRYCWSSETCFIFLPGHTRRHFRWHTVRWACGNPLGTIWIGLHWRKRRRRYFVCICERLRNSPVCGSRNFLVTVWRCLLKRSTIKIQLNLSLLLLMCHWKVLRRALRGFVFFSPPPWGMGTANAWCPLCSHRDYFFLNMGNCQILHLLVAE